MFRTPPLNLRFLNRDDSQARVLAREGFETMIVNAELRKALNQAAFAISQQEFARIRAELEELVELAEKNGASQEDLVTLVRQRVINGRTEHG